MAHKCLLDSASKVVINVIELEESVQWIAPEGTELAPQHDGSVGDIWNGTQFIKPIVEQVQLEKPTKEQLLAQLQALQSQIQALE